MLYIVWHNLKHYYILLLVCMACTVWAHCEAGGERKMSPASNLLPVDAITPIPQMWPWGWHARLSRWWLPWRQRAWPVLAHTVTPTVPTYHQLDAKWQRHVRHLPPAADRGHMCSKLREEKLKRGCAAIWNQEIWNQICHPQIEPHQLKGCWNIWPGISGVGRWFCCWWAVSYTEKRFAETAHNSSLGTNDSDMQMCLLPFCFPPQPAHKRQGEWKCLIMSLSVSFIYLYAVIKNSFFTKT